MPRLSIVFSALFAALCSVITLSAQETDEAKQLDTLFEEEWEWSMREYPTWASHLGDLRYNSQWEDESLAAYRRRHEHRQEVLARISAIDPAKLSPQDRINRELFVREIAQDIESYPLAWHLVPLTARSGIQDASSTADSLKFERVQDYEDWIARMHAFPDYMDQTIELMREGIRLGRLLPKIVMQRVPSQIERQIVDDPKQSLFYKPFRSVSREISKEDQQRLATEAGEVIANKIVPSYRKFLTFFNEEYFPSCYDQVGAWQVPEGQKIYAMRARHFTTTNLTPAEIHELGLREVARIRTEMKKIIAQVKFEGSFDEFLEYLRTDRKFYCDDQQQLLNEYKAVCERIDPELSRLFKRQPRIPYDIQQIPPHLAPDTTTAYYRQPSSDGSRPGTYFVNLYKPEVRPRYEMMALSLHESVPGHHFQIAFAMELDNLPAFRRYGGYTAFVEGWALYAESLGDELGLYDDPYSKFGQLTYEMWRAVRLVVDTGMHSMKWSRQQSIDFFAANTAKTMLDIENEIDRYIAWPGQALAYKIGELKIKELRNRSTQKLGNKFDLKEFHDVVLSNGAVPLDVLETIVDEWIERQL
ncbi:MAG TPA: DUF885 domain-containing protein [Planctomycetaceae bacterium]|nr:DUF885 domain-containing protein [Planctomycetaceae bacterium]